HRRRHRGCLVADDGWTYCPGPDGRAIALRGGAARLSGSVARRSPAGPRQALRYEATRVLADPIRGVLPGAILWTESLTLPLLSSPSTLRAGSPQLRIGLDVSWLATDSEGIWHWTHRIFTSLIRSNPQHQFSLIWPFPSQPPEAVRAL